MEAMLTSSPTTSSWRRFPDDLVPGRQREYIGLHPLDNGEGAMLRPVSLGREVV